MWGLLPVFYRVFVQVCNSVAERRPRAAVMASAASEMKSPIPPIPLTDIPTLLLPRVFFSSGSDGVLLRGRAALSAHLRGGKYASSGDR